MLNLTLNLNVHLLVISQYVITHNYNKLILLKVYIAIHKFDIIGLSETYLDSSTTSDDDNLEINTVVFVCITKTFCLCKFSVFIICKNVSIPN